MILLACVLLQEFTVLEAGELRVDRSKDKPRFERLLEEKSLKEFWELAHRGPAQEKPCPAVDFKEWMVVGILTSSAVPWGTGLKMESVKEDRGTLVITYDLKATGVDGGPAARWPYALVKLKRSTAALRFVERLMPNGKLDKEQVIKELNAIK
jgi:hypothetical protein